MLNLVPKLTRRRIIKALLTLTGWIIIEGYLKAATRIIGKEKQRKTTFGEGSFKAPFIKDEFGYNFSWGAACASYQVEGSIHGTKGKDIWEQFSHTKGKIKTGENADHATDFYHRYEEDISILSDLNIKNFRFSIAWSRILPEGKGTVNQEGIEYYHRIINCCHEKGITPWITLYHWDLPQALEDKGGWVNRDILNWFSEYVDLVTKEYGAKVKNWMVLNEPFAFIGLGYMLGLHAPGKKGVKNFMPAAHHAALIQAEGGRIIRNNVVDANIGTTFSVSFVDPINNKQHNLQAAKRIDALLNRFFIEPALGLGYPSDVLPMLEKMKEYYLPGDEERLKFDFDFIGIQNYFRVVAKYSLFPPVIWAKEVSATKRNVPVNDMNGEISPDGFYKILKQFGQYPNIKKIIITENGVCFPDKLENGHIHDNERIKFFEDYLQSVLRAKQEGVNVEGYFVWSLTDNFEWAEGFKPRFGLIYIDYPSQKRYVKDSGYWFREFLK